TISTIITGHFHLRPPNSNRGVKKDENRQKNLRNARQVAELEDFESVHFLPKKRTPKIIRQIHGKG
ncbi:TPA: hypothetical protein ACGO3K_001630, partial [Streptococcus suis]